ncbi:MAG: cryptochrome/photolyase family protein, partial [Candidatus Babeliales bacterium]
MGSITLIFPHQLYREHPALMKTRPIMLYEHKHFFSSFCFYIGKRVFHRASMKAYEQWLVHQGYTIFYIDYDSTHSWDTLSKKYQIDEMHYMDPVDSFLEKELAQLSFRMIVYESKMFLTDRSLCHEYAEKRTMVRMASFYRMQRRRLTILMDKDEPVGGSWSFDKDNRKPVPQNITLP